ncbi:MAG TPA: 3'(2'),5'-bisphosphate nucleotidase CysQ [Polyangiaceae bacterium]|nr:3'(2'),5'-bisphosphate nucleotidase CysQ [Polyangiaceae bacterium]
MERELEVAGLLAREAGGLILGYFKKGLAVEAKDNDEPVTLADRQASEFIVGGLQKAFPSDLIISEEAAPDLKRLVTAQRVWFVDPLDGTKEFIRGLTNFSVLIGLCVEGVPSLGVVYQPIGDVLYRAAPRHPAEQIDQRGATRLRVSTVSAVSQARLTVSESDRRPVLDDIKHNLGIEKEHPMGSVGLKFCMIANQNADLYINPTAGAKAWDTCASAAILTSAGGQVSDVFGTPLLYRDPELWHTRGIVASNGFLHASAIGATRAVFEGKTQLD